ncbi:MAG: hypothetical protein WCI02_13475 [Planctomycetota bacterium]
MARTNPFRLSVQPNAAAIIVVWRMPQSGNPAFGFEIRGATREISARLASTDGKTVLSPLFYVEVAANSSLPRASPKGRREWKAGMVERMRFSQDDFRLRRAILNVP